MKKLPFVSIVVCTYNGSRRIKDCLDSLVIQNYPKNKSEIIVINDGSTDNTSEVVSRYPIKVVNHPKNLGICAARNSGLNNASGEIIAYTDDDCIADKNWVVSLIKQYKKDVIAVGGITIPFSRKSIMEKYMDESGYGNPTPFEYAKSKNPVYRFFVYLKDMFSSLIITKVNPIRVRSIYTLNASYKRKVLIEAGGWLKGYDFREDSEMSDRLNRLFPSKKILFTKDAVITHKHRTSFLHFLKQTYFRSESTLKCYVSDRKIPPVFPFPIFILCLSILFSFTNLFLGIWLLITLPQIFYSWWLFKFFKNFNGSFLLFPYMQFSLELAEILGMLMGFIKIYIRRFI